MQQIRTRKLVRSRTNRSAGFLQRYRASLVILKGGGEGHELPLDREKISLGRGPGVDLAIDDPTMSREHAVFELDREGYRVRDLGSTNGVVVNDIPAQAADLEHGDRIGLGEHVFQYVLEEKSRVPPIHTLPETA